MSKQKYIVWYHYKIFQLKEVGKKGIFFQKHKEKSITMLSTVPVAEAWRMLL